MSPSLVALRPPPRHALGAWQRRTPCEDHSRLPPRGNRHKSKTVHGRIFWPVDPLLVTDAGRLGSSGSSPARPRHRPHAPPALVGSALGLRRRRPWCATRSRASPSGSTTRPEGTIEAGSLEGTGAGGVAIRGALPRAARHPRSKRLPQRASSGLFGRRPPAAWRAGGGRVRRDLAHPAAAGPARLRARAAGAGSLVSWMIPCRSRARVLADVILPAHRKKCKVAASRRARTRSSSRATTPGCARPAGRRSASPPGRRIAQSSLPSAPVRNSREQPARAAQPRKSAADSTSGSAGQTSSGGRELANFRPDSDFPTNFRAAGRISTSPAMRHHAPLSSTGVLQVKRCGVPVFRHHADSTAVLGQNSVALRRFQCCLGPKSYARMRHVAHRPPASILCPKQYSW
jgi:hypothetical protein